MHFILGLQTVRCFYCSEYKNKYEGQAPTSQSVNITGRSQSIPYEQLCHDLNPVTRPNLVVTCSKTDYCVKAVVKRKCFLLS